MYSFAGRLGDDSPVITGDTPYKLLATLEKACRWTKPEFTGHFSVIVPKIPVYSGLTAPLP